MFRAIFFSDLAAAQPRESDGCLARGDDVGSREQCAGKDENRELETVLD